MKFIRFCLIAVAMSLTAAPPAVVTITPNPVTSGATYVINACHISRTTADVLITDAYQFVQFTVPVNPDGCIDVPQSATYTVDTGTFNLPPGTVASVYVTWNGGGKIAWGWFVVQ